MIDGRLFFRAAGNEEMGWKFGLGQIMGCRSKSEGIAFDLSDKQTFFAWQRNHMANERTFLAWCRTGISLIVFAFVIERFDFLIREMKVLAPHPELMKYPAETPYLALLIFALGAGIIIIAGGRFLCVRRHINQGEPDFSPLPDIFLMTSVLVMILMIILLFVSLL